MKKIVYFVCIVALIWLVASFVDVNMHNGIFSDNYQQYASWNLFAML